MDKFSYIYKTKFRKMGKWNLLPLDSCTWHIEETSKYFKKIFGFGKGTFIIQTLDDNLQHAYFPQFYINKIYDYIHKTNKHDYKKLEKIIQTFYPLRKKAVKNISKTKILNLNKLTNKELLKAYLFNRDWVHRVTPYDQFGWVAEDYWNSVLEKILLKHGLAKNSSEYLKTLFTLVKPEEISTTLIEKREILKQAILIKARQKTINQASNFLAKKFGWMPVFAFGVPWDEKHYRIELREVILKNYVNLKKEHQILKAYRKLRNIEIKAIIAKYKFSKEDLQKFIDFGLCLDARNEAEYFVSLCGFYLLPIYNEIAKRLFVSVKQLRNFVEPEVADCLLGKEETNKIIKAQGKILGWVFDKSMARIKYLKSIEAEKFYRYLNKNSINLQGDIENAGICASPGKVRGRAIITHYPSENNKVKSGDILITHATTVDYLPAMKRAAAFVTEVGGLTCHAAVVAREFGVPCIVSLKNATKNFKDGDLVEVDADKGIVKIIKR